MTTRTHGDMQCPGCRTTIYIQNDNYWWSKEPCRIYTAENEMPYAAMPSWTYQQQDRTIFHDNNKNKGSTMITEIIYTKQPSQLEEQAGESEQIVAGPFTVTAAGTHEAVAVCTMKNMKAIEDGLAKWKISIDRVTITHRKFA